MAIVQGCFNWQWAQLLPDDVVHFFQGRYQAVSRCWLLLLSLVPMNAVPDYPCHIVSIGGLIQVCCQLSVIQDIPHPVTEVVISRGNVMTEGVGSHVLQAIGHIRQATIYATINSIKTLLAAHPSQHRCGVLFSLCSHITTSKIIILLDE
jgi:hypothetical protein